MQLGRLALVGLVLIALAGCTLATTGSPSPASPSGAPSPASPSGSPGPSGSPEPSNSLDDPVIDSAGLPSLTAGQVCALLTEAEATAALGIPLADRPLGDAEPDDHAQCIYQDANALLPGTYLQVGFNTRGFAGEAIMVNLHRDAHTLRVGGFEAIGADAETDPAVDNAVLSVKLGMWGSDPALWIEAPTLAIAKEVALLILPRLAGQP
jgi:hypothetical protein